MIKHNTRDGGGYDYKDDLVVNLVARGKASKSDRFNRRVVGLPETEVAAMNKFTGILKSAMHLKTLLCQSEQSSRRIGINNNNGNISKMVKALDHQVGQSS